MGDYFEDDNGISGLWNYWKQNSFNSWAVVGDSKYGAGVLGLSDTGDGVQGWTIGGTGISAAAAFNATGLSSFSEAGDAGQFFSDQGNGLWVQTGTGGTGITVLGGPNTGIWVEAGTIAVQTFSLNGTGLLAQSGDGTGVIASTDYGFEALVANGSQIGAHGRIEGGGKSFNFEFVIDPRLFEYENPPLAGVWGEAKGAIGVAGTSDSFIGVYGFGTPGVRGDDADGGNIGVEGLSNSGVGVVGRATAGKDRFIAPPPSTGVFGQGFVAGVEGDSDNGTGIIGRAIGVGPAIQPQPQTGVFGQGDNIGVEGDSYKGTGVVGRAIENDLPIQPQPQTGVCGQGDNIGVEGLSNSGVGVVGRATDSKDQFIAPPPSTGVFGQGFMAGVEGDSDNGTGVIGRAIGTDSARSAPTSTGVFGQGDNTGVEGDSYKGAGVIGRAIENDLPIQPQPQTGVFGQGDIIGVEGDSDHGVGVIGRVIGNSPTQPAPAQSGVFGQGTRGVVGFGQIALGSWSPSGISSGGTAGVVGASDTIGVFGTSGAGGGVGVQGYGYTVNHDGSGVIGGGDRYGVQGWANSTGTQFGIGVYGLGSVGVAGYGSSGGSGVLGQGYVAGIFYGNGPFSHPTDPLAGCFLGDVYISGNVNVLGQVNKAAVMFRIDHPLEPTRKYLSHSAVESAELKNMYDGIVTLDKSGQATIALPRWFESLNENFRYQLTPIGSSAPGLFVSKKLANNRFKIAGGDPGLEVSWQITGIRRDAWAKANPLSVEQKKSKKDVGTYLHPQAFGQKPAKDQMPDAPNMDRFDELFKKHAAAMKPAAKPSRRKDQRSNRIPAAILSSLTKLKRLEMAPLPKRAKPQKLKRIPSPVKPLKKRGKMTQSPIDAILAQSNEINKKLQKKRDQHLREVKTRFAKLRKIAKSRGK